VQAGRQRLKTDDRESFPYGCSAEGNFDRYCSDGTYDLYDFRSEGERRRQDALAASLKGRIETGGVRHDVAVGVLQSRVRNRFNPQAFNFAGIGNVQGTLVVPPNPAAAIPSTDQDERSTELSVSDAIRWSDRWSTWVGLRHTRLHRASVRTDGTSPTAYDQSVTTPWAAISYRLSPAATAYASWGQGVESQVVPNLPQFANAGQALPALKSRQVEAGVKGGADRLAWQVAWFRINRPVSSLDACNRLFITPCTVASDGEAVHQGLEGSAQWQSAQWRLGGSAMLLDAERRGSTVEPAINGLRPTNVPRVVLRANAAVKVPAVPGLELQGYAAHEGSRAVLADNSLTLPGWTRFDAALRYDTRMGRAATSWILGVDNIANRRYWRESPFMFSHVYLYPGAPRTVRLTFTASL
jgi:iron complex outermembrane receptor protein